MYLTVHLKEENVAAPEVSFCLWLEGAVDHARDMWTTESVSLVGGQGAAAPGAGGSRGCCLSHSAACMITVLTPVFYKSSCNRFTGFMGRRDHMITWAH